MFNNLLILLNSSRIIKLILCIFCRSIYRLHLVDKQHRCWQKNEHILKVSTICRMFCINECIMLSDIIVKEKDIFYVNVLQYLFRGASHVTIVKYKDLAFYGQLDFITFAKNRVLYEKSQSIQSLVLFLFGIFSSNLNATVGRIKHFLYRSILVLSSTIQIIFSTKILLINIWTRERFSSSSIYMLRL